MTGKPRQSFWGLWNISFGFFGIQIAFGLQNANVSRIFQTLGAEVDNLAYLWIAGPVTGLLVQPLVGHFSDHRWTRFGRRRPYFLLGALLAGASLFAMPYAPILLAAAAGVVLWLSRATTLTAAVAPAGGTKPLLGTNPFAFGWPRPGGDPYVFDIATSVAARVEIELHRRAGTPIPEGWALGPDGRPTTDPAAALAGAMLPFGGHKGSALGTMIELLGACLIGDLTSRACLDRTGSTALSPIHGELLIAFAPEVFARGRDGDPFAQADSLFGAILGQGARLPSQRRFAARARSLSEGIGLSAESLARLDELRSA